MYFDVITLINELDTEIQEPRLRTVSSRIDDCPDTAVTVNNHKDHFKFFAFYPIIDSLLQGLRERFNQETTGLIRSVGKVVNFSYDRDDLTFTCK